ncbi:MAG: DUF134 domain-containing protein [Candidatus Acetothermia bacterium]
MVELGGTRGYIHYEVAMPRRKKTRYCRPFDGPRAYKPAGVPMNQLSTNQLALDEMEAMRLCDQEDLDQEQAAEMMNISRGTLQRLLYSGRKKTVDALINGKALSISDGSHIVQREHGRHRRRGNP